MADTMKCYLPAGPGDAIYFSPLFDFRRPDARKRSTHRTRSGKLYIYEWSTADYDARYEIPVSKISYTDYALIVSYWQNKYDLIFYPDLVSDPTGAILIQIVNEERPLSMMTGMWREYYEGTLILQESGEVPEA